MKPTYSNARKLAWYPDIACPVCGGDVNSWDMSSFMLFPICASYCNVS